MSVSNVSKSRMESKLRIDEYPFLCFFSQKNILTKPNAHFFFLNVDENLGLKRFPKTKQSKLMKIIFKPNATAVRRFFVALVDLNVDESLFAFFLLIEPQDFFQSRFRWRLRYKKKRWKQLIEFCRGLKPEPKDLYISSVSRWFFSLDSLGVTLLTIICWPNLA